MISMSKKRLTMNKVDKNLSAMPVYPNNILDEVRNSVNIVSIISEYIPLRKRGRNHVALCPFHSEKTASFNVNEERQIFYCFGCNLGGDVFRFLMQIESLSFPDSVQFLAKQQGVTLPVANAAVGVEEFRKREKE